VARKERFGPLKRDLLNPATETGALPFATSARLSVGSNLRTDAGRIAAPGKSNKETELAFCLLLSLHFRQLLAEEVLSP